MEGRAVMWSMDKVRRVSWMQVRQAVEMDVPIEEAMTVVAGRLKRSLHHELEATVAYEDIRLYVIAYRWPERLALWGAHWAPEPRPAMLDGKVHGWTQPPRFRAPFDPIMVRDVLLDASWHPGVDHPDRPLPRPREVRCSGWDPSQRLWVYQS